MAPLNTGGGEPAQRLAALCEIWGSSAGSMATELPSLRVFMATLRKKLEADPGHPEYIQTHIGVGYRMIQHNRDSAASPET